MDPRNKTTTLTYDLFDLRSSKDPLNRTMTYQTDALGRRTVIVDPLGQRTYFEYDVMDRVVKTTDAQGRVTTMAYDSIGNLTARYRCAQQHAQLHLRSASSSRDAPKMPCCVLTVTCTTTRAT